MSKAFLLDYSVVNFSMLPFSNANSLKDLHFLEGFFLVVIRFVNLLPKSWRWAFHQMESGHIVWQYFFLVYQTSLVQKRADITIHILEVYGMCHSGHRNAANRLTTRFRIMTCASEL